MRERERDQSTKSQSLSSKLLLLIDDLAVQQVCLRVLREVCVCVCEVLVMFAYTQFKISSSHAHTCGCTYTHMYRIWMHTHRSHIHMYTHTPVIITRVVLKPTLTAILPLFTALAWPGNQYNSTYSFFNTIGSRKSKGT